MKAIEGFLKRGQQPAPVKFILAIFKHLTDYKVKRDLTILPQRRIKVNEGLFKSRFCSFYLLKNTH